MDPGVAFHNAPQYPQEAGVPMDSRPTPAAAAAAAQQQQQAQGGDRKPMSGVPASKPLHFMNSTRLYDDF